MTQQRRLPTIGDILRHCARSIGPCSLDNRRSSSRVSLDGVVRPSTRLELRFTDIVRTSECGSVEPFPADWVGTNSSTRKIPFRHILAPNHPIELEPIEVGLKGIENGDAMRRERVHIGTKVWPRSAGARIGNNEVCTDPPDFCDEGHRSLGVVDADEIGDRVKIGAKTLRVDDLHAIEAI